MKNRNTFLERHKEHHPQVGFGLFLIVLGLALMVATNDWLGLGSVKDYFTWETLLVFIGALLLLNLQFTGGIVMISLGIWFFMENRDYKIPEIIRTAYWPAVIVLIGLGFIISSLFRTKGKSN